MMRWIYKLPLRLRSLFRKSQVESDLGDEIRYHLEELTALNIAKGMAPDSARRAALRELGGIEQIKEECRDMRRVNFIESLIQDLRYGLRQLRRSPGITAVAVLSLALGIGANTAIFSLMNAVMLRNLPVKDPSQLVLLGGGRAAGSTNDIDTELYSWMFYRELQQKNRVFSSVSATTSLLFRSLHGAVGSSGALEPINVQLVSGTYFSMLGITPVVGRSFTQADDEPAGGHPIAIASYSWWKRRFGRDPSILGKTVTFRSTIYTIIGVAPPDFFGMTVGQSPDLWIPQSMVKEISPGWNGLDNKWFESLYIFARLKPGVSTAQADANVNLLAKQIWHSFAGPVLTRDQQQTLSHTHIPLTSAARGLSRLRFQYSKPLLILMILVMLVLLIACANIANLLLARATTRQKEISLRMAIGAGRGRLIRQMLTESLLMAFIGGALGVVLAWWGSDALLAMVSTGAERLPIKVSPDTTVLLFALVISIATALIFGVIPALRATRVELTPALKEGQGASATGGRSRLAKSLIVGQVGLSLVLLVGAGLFLRTLVNLTNIDTGFNQQNVLLFSIDPADVGYKKDQRLLNLYQQIEQNIGAQPGVRADSISFFTFDQGAWDDSATVPGNNPPSGIPNDVLFNITGTGYFKTMGIPLLAGRGFNAHDTAASPKVAVINETMANAYFPGGSPIGRHFTIGDSNSAQPLEVVGVVQDAKYMGLEERHWPAAYFPYAQTQNPHFYSDLEVRYSGDPGIIISEVRKAVSQVDRRLPIAYQRTLAEQVGDSIARQKLTARLSAFFGFLAVFLSIIGIYGVMSYAVTRRTNEIGIRMALGAQPAGVLRMILREVLFLTAASVAVGVPAALAGGHWVASILYDLKPTDPLILGIAIAALVIAALAAGFIPALRASRVNPMTALRHE